MNPLKPQAMWVVGVVVKTRCHAVAGTLAYTRRGAIELFTDYGAEDWQSLKEPKGCYRAMKVIVKPVTPH